MSHDPDAKHMPPCPGCGERPARICADCAGISRMHWPEKKQATELIIDDLAEQRDLCVRALRAVGALTGEESVGDVVAAWALVDEALERCSPEVAL